MNKDKEFSYLIATKNKLPYLKFTLDKLIAQKKPDEEILVADGASTDGTKDYLANLKNTGAIDYYISEPDFGNGHALNKLILFANSNFFMVITDDDAYDYSVLNSCKKFMSEHPEIDLVATNGGIYCASSSKEDRGGFAFRALTYTANFKEWQKSHKPFSFCELGLILRRSSLPVIGLRDTSFRRADAEFSLRITAGKANLAWCTRYSFVNILNEKSISKTYMKRMKDETDRLNKFYLNENRDSFITEKLRVIKNKIRTFMVTKKNYSTSDANTPWTSLVEKSERWLEEKNKNFPLEFIYNH